MAKWECDGCLREIEHDDPEFVCGCKDHWGWMLVGGQAWEDYHDKDIHPMNGIISDLKKLRIPNS